MRRRDFIKGITGSTLAWPLAARAQQPSLPAIGFLRSTSLADAAHLVTGFRNALWGVKRTYSAVAEPYLQNFTANARRAMQLAGRASTSTCGNGTGNFD